MQDEEDYNTILRLQKEFPRILSMKALETYPFLPTVAFLSTPF
jgi:hypothetical protein